jgi:hypothetical protein
LLYSVPIALLVSLLYVTAVLALVEGGLYAARRQSAVLGAYAPHRSATPQDGMERRAGVSCLRRTSPSGGAH